MNHAELTYIDVLSWQDHPDVYLAREIMESYAEFSSDLTPMEFIRQYWGEASPAVQLEMIEYIEQRPFPGCEKYLQQWNSYLEHNRGRVLSLF